MNYNSLMNKPTINYRELIGDNSVTEVGGITEEQFNTLLNTDLSSYYTKAQIDDLFSRSYVYREKSGSIVTFECPASVNGIDKVVSEIVAVQSGTGDPSPTNVRPISGWSAVNVLDRGKNLFVTTASSGTAGGVIYTVNDDGSVTVSGTATAGTAYAIGRARVSSAMGKVTISAIGTATNISYNNISLYDQSDTLLATITSGSTQTTFTFDLSSYPTAYSIKMSVKRRDNGACSGVLKPQVEIGEIATEFVPFNGTTYTTTLKDGQGNPMTCYGGQLSNVNGVQSLTLTHGYIASYNGETLPSTWISDRDVYAEGTTPTTGAEVVYLLANPQQIPQDNLAIATQEGTNNLWADSGNITVKALDKIIQG